MCSHYISDLAFLQLRVNMRFVIVTFTLIIFSGFSHSNKVEQSPPDVIQRLGESAKIRCQHSVPSYNQINWYRQNQDQGFTSMGYLFLKGPNTEKEFAKKIEMSGNGNSDGSLTIKSLSSNDSAVYFCAAYYSYAKLEFGEGTKLTVLATNITLPKVKILPPSPREICSHKETNSNLTLVCVATGFYPDHVSLTWKVNGEERENSVSTDSTAQQDKTTLLYHISSRMKVSKRDWMDPRNHFTCTVRFYNGKDYVNVTDTIKAQKEKPKGLKLLGFGYTLFLSKSLLYALIVSGAVWKLKSSKKMKPFPED